MCAILCSATEVDIDLGESATEEGSRREEKRDEKRFKYKEQKRKFLVKNKKNKIKIFFFPGAAPICTPFLFFFCCSATPSTANIATQKYTINRDNYIIVYTDKIKSSV